MEPFGLFIQPQPQVWRSFHCEEEVKDHSKIYKKVKTLDILLQASGTVHRLREREEELLKVWCLASVRLLSYLRGVHAWGFRWPKGERGTHAVVGVANNEQVQLVSNQP